MLHFVCVIGRFTSGLMVGGSYLPFPSSPSPFVPTGGLRFHGNTGEITDLVIESAGGLAQVLLL